MRLLGAGLFLLVASCVPYVEPDQDRTDYASCEEIRQHLDLRRPIPALNLVSAAYERGCHDLVIKYGNKALRRYRYKTHFWSREAASIFVPEEMVTDYVLESYERAYLSFLIAASYIKRGETEDSQVEMRRMNDEMRALLYTHGEDPVNILLQAVMWDFHQQPEESRVDWSRLREAGGVGEPLRLEADRRVSAIDGGSYKPPEWKIHAFGEFPKVEWDLKFKNPKRGYLKVWADHEFSEDCASTTGFRISTRSWFEKIAMRHQHRYHTLMFAKSWIRLPIGVAYNVATIAAGAAVAVGGCGAGAGVAVAGIGAAAVLKLDPIAEKGVQAGGAICEVSIEGGTAVVAKAPEVMEHAVRPDLRHWENLPEGFLVTTKDDFAQEECYLPARGIRKVL